MQTSHLFKIWIIPNPNTHVLSNIIDTVEQKAKQYVRLFPFKCLRNITDGHTYIKVIYANNTFTNSPTQYVAIFI